MSYETILFEQNQSVATIAINRPQVLNALNAKVIEELTHCVEGLTKRFPEIRVVVVKGGGEKAFVAGADIAAMSTMSVEEALQFARLGQDLSQKIEALPQITVAAVQGFALGGGCELAMACDLIIASTKAKFGQPEVGLGLIPGFGGTQRLARRIGFYQAMDILTTGRIITSDEALRMGLISRMGENLDELLQETVNGLLKGAPLALRELKKLVQLRDSMDLKAGLQCEASQFANCFATAQAKAGLSAFLKKEPPSYVQKI